MLKLLELLTALMALVKKAREQMIEGKLKNAAKESLEKSDQRKLEDALGGSAGPSDDSRIPGVYERPREKKD